SGRERVGLKSVRLVHGRSPSRVEACYAAPRVGPIDTCRFRGFVVSWFRGFVSFVPYLRVFVPSWFHLARGSTSRILEVDLHPELKFPRVGGGAADAAERTRREVQLRHAEVDVVECVERVDPQLDVHRLV